jgi:ABC-type hemin transport system substrate-binding protein
MGVKDGGQLQSMAAEIIQYRLGIARVNYSGEALVANQPDVIVVESGNGNNLHGAMVKLTRHDVNG